jgi:hypothetical protein
MATLRVLVGTAVLILLFSLITEGITGHAVVVAFAGATGAALGYTLASAIARRR